MLTTNIIGTVNTDVCTCTMDPTAGSLPTGDLSNSLIPIPTQTVENAADCATLQAQLNSSGQYANPITCTVETVTTYEMRTTTAPNDGFILAETARDAPGRTYLPIEMKGSGHMQMKNDSGMEAAVMSIFEDGLNGNFFKTPMR